MSDNIYNSDFYNKIFKNYRLDDYFEETVIRINYIKNITQNSGERLYKIQSLFLEGSEESSEFQGFKEIVERCNTLLLNNKYPIDWQVFYLYKELLQNIIDKYNFNYFRGQSHKYDLVPGILRNDVQNSYRESFENLYLKIANEFPDKISYFPIEGREHIENREYQLSLLQHYGLKTSLLDITSNPYIALLFMLSEQIDSYKEPTLFLFKLDESSHRQNHLFTEVRKSHLNERIIAQKGAFLNFDKLFDIKQFDVQKVSIVKIILQFDDNDFLTKLNSDIENISSLGSGSEDESEKAEFIELLESEKLHIEESKIETLKYILEEISKKLREYHYFEEELFPDFEQRIKYLSAKYESNFQKQLTKE